MFEPNMSSALLNMAISYFSGLLIMIYLVIKYSEKIKEIYQFVINYRGVK